MGKRHGMDYSGVYVLIPRKMNDKLKRVAHKSPQKFVSTYLEQLLFWHLSTLADPGDAVQELINDHRD